MGLWPLKNLEKIGENSSWLGAQLCNLHQRNLTSIQSTIITYIITIFGRVHDKFSVPWVHNRTPKNISNCNCNCLELLKTSFFAVFDWFFDWFWVDTVSVGHAMSTNGAPPALNRGSPRGEPHHHVVANLMTSHYNAVVHINNSAMSSHPHGWPIHVSVWWMNWGPFMIIIFTSQWCGTSKTSTKDNAAKGPFRKNVCNQHSDERAESKKRRERQNTQPRD